MGPQMNMINSRIVRLLSCSHLRFMSYFHIPKIECYILEVFCKTSTMIIMLNEFSGKKMTICEKARQVQACISLLEELRLVSGKLTNARNSSSRGLMLWSGCCGQSDSYAHNHTKTHVRFFIIAVNFVYWNIPPKLLFVDNELLSAHKVFRNRNGWTIILRK